MRKSLFMNGVEIMAIIDGRFYIPNDEYGWECLVECTKNQFIEKLKQMSWVCLTTWCKELKQEYLDLVDYTNQLEG